MQVVNNDVIENAEVKKKDVAIKDEELKELLINMEILTM